MTREEAREYVSIALGQNETTEWLLDYLEDAWESLDELTKIFGSEQARILLLAHAGVTFPNDSSEQLYDRTNRREDLHLSPGRT